MSVWVLLKCLKPPQAVSGYARPQLARTLYVDRRDAGKTLAAAVREELGEKLLSERPLVLAIPRGGVLIGCEVATALDADLDLVVPRKLGAEGNPEYAIGAVMHDGTLYLNPEALRLTGASAEYIDGEKTRETTEAVRRLKAYRSGRQEPTLSG